MTLTDTSPQQAVLKLLLIDDDDLVHATLKKILPAQWRLLSIRDPKVQECAELIESADCAWIDLHLTHDLSTADGLTWIQKLQEQRPDLEVIAISGDFSRDLMEQSLKAGASRFLAKPIHKDETLSLLKKIEAHLQLIKRSKIDQLNSSRTDWIGSSPESQRVLKEIALQKGESHPILILGETGTGKEVVAQILNSQENDSAKQRPFIAVNVAAIPENLFEAELFGYVKGAFTGADQTRMGLAELAHQGDLFFDEIEALAPSHQAKLLRFLETGEVRKIGARESVRVETRVISASNRDLKEMVRNGEFREDLLWRISGQVIQLPSLKDRIDDVEELATVFLKKANPRRAKELATDAIAALKAKSWPGNVRELRRICEQLNLIAPLPMIRALDVDQLFTGAEPTRPIDLSLGLIELTGRYESELIRASLKASKDVDGAADLLKVSRSTLYKKMKDYGIER